MNGLGQVAIAACVFVATFVAQLPLHELAHAVAGWVVGLRIVQVQIGSGRPLIRKRFGGVAWQLNLTPFGGETSAVPPADARFVRLRIWLFTLAGPLFDLLLVAALWKLSARLADVDLLGGSAWIAAAAALACSVRAASSLLPSAPTGSGATSTAGSDGWQLATIPFMTARDVAALQAPTQE